MFRGLKSNESRKAKPERSPLSSDSGDISDLSPGELITDYLDHLCAPLIPILTFRERERLRDEARFHIERLAQEEMNRGSNELCSVQNAIRRYGKSYRISESFLEEWNRYRGKNWMVKFLGKENAIAFLAVFLAYIPAFGLMHFHRLFDRAAPYTFGLSLEQVRHVIPEPLPLPEHSVSFTLLFAYLFIAPVITGWVIGSKVILRSARSSYHACLVFTILSFYNAFSMLPDLEGYWVSLAVLCWWLPIVPLVSHLRGQLIISRRLNFNLD